MLSPRWQKVRREIVNNKKRSMMVIASITIGTLAVGLASGAQAILSRELPRVYAASNPAGALFVTTSLDDDNLVSIRRIPGINCVEGRRSFLARIQSGNDQWSNIIIFAVSDFAHQRVNQIERVTGPWPPGERQILLEQSALPLYSGPIGEPILIRLNDGDLRTLQFSGVVHDPSQQPSTFEGTLYGYISLDSLEWLDEPRQYNQLYVTTSPEFSDRSTMRLIAGRVREKIEASGGEVLSMNVPEPGKHPLQDTVDGILLLLGVFGGLNLVLSGFLVFNTLSALLNQQIRQVGIMKAVGARTFQLAQLYMGMALIFGLLAILISAPLGLIGARLLAQFIAQVINVDLLSLEVPLRVIVLECTVGLLAALFAAVYPVVAGTRTTIRESLSYNLMHPGQFALGWLSRAAFLPLSATLALRNSLRHRGRLALTLTTMTLSSAFFIAVMSVYASTQVSIEEVFHYWQYDLYLNLDRSYRVEELEPAVLATPGVIDVDPGFALKANQVKADGSQGDALFFYVLPANTFCIQPKLIAGRWLIPEDENAIVISNKYLDENPGVQVGDRIRLKLIGKELDWIVVGIVHMMFTDGPTVYANLPYYAQAMNMANHASQLYVLADRHDPEAQQQLTRDLEQRLADRGIHINYSLSMYSLRESMRSLFNVIVVILMIMAVLLSLVGGIGLMGIMDINVIERSREIGVMRAIGATGPSLLWIILVEGWCIGLISWLLGCALALPLSKLLSDAVGLAVMRTPFVYCYSFTGAALWLVLVMLLTTCACSLPAVRASQITIREAIAYE